MTSAEKLRRIAGGIGWMFPADAADLLRVADEHQRMAECLDGLVRLSIDVQRARESVAG